jgi:hypothetical protein
LGETRLPSLRSISEIPDERPIIQVLPRLRASTLGLRYDYRLAIGPMFESERIEESDLKPNRLIDFLRPPFRKFEFSTRTSTEHAARVLEEIVEPPRKWGWPTSTKRGYFEGRVAGGRFKIHRIVYYRNSFVPIIEGQFRRENLGTTVTLNMRLAWVALVFWLAVIVFLAWISVSVDSPLAEHFGARMFLFGMTLFIYLVATIPFTVEMRIAIKRLLEVLRPGGTEIHRRR